MWKIIIGIFCCYLGLGELSAQSGKEVNDKAYKLFLQAKAAFRKEEKEEALRLLEKAKNFDGEFSALYLLEADIFNKWGERNREIGAIEMALALDSLKGHPYYYFVLAEFYFDQADYVRALDFYRHYLTRDKRLQVKRQAECQVNNCKFAVKALQSQPKQSAAVFYESDFPVYWPALDVMGETLLITEQKGDREKMWMVKDGVRYALNFDVAGNYGAPSLTADGQTMYFSMESGRTGFDIYAAYRLNDTTWSEPVNLGYPVNTDGWDAQPAISADGTKLYFASTREGGRGGSDIWFSHLLRREADGRQVWSQPRCLYFNTEKDEMAPFLYFDNRTLFFSSDGYPGMGRKDVYKVDVVEVSEPLNIGITVNTQKNELGFMVDGSGEWGYFSSDVSGKRCIYRYRLDEQVACPPAAYVWLALENEQGIPTVPDHLTLVGVETGDTLACYDAISARERMPICVPINELVWVGAMKKGYLYYSDTLRMKEAAQTKVPAYTLRLRSVREGQTSVLKGVFFDVDDYRLKPESYPELRQLVMFLKQNPEVKIEISGHTDNTGDDEHNYRLSENRAFEVYKYLFLNHIPKERMEYKGYGKDRPVAPNDTESGRARNRRTEIKIREK